MRRNLIAMQAGFLAMWLCCTPAAQADVGPPISIKMPADRALAVSGQEYHGEFQLRVYERGTLSDIRIVGNGWTIVSLELPPTTKDIDAGPYRVPFRAIPENADEPLALELKFNGRSARRQYRVGPSAFATKGKPRFLAATPAPPDQQARNVPQPPNAGPDGPTPHGGTLSIQGRVAYIRSGRDFTDPPDGDFTDPEDTPPMTVGADSILVELWDVDPTSNELMWRGLTTEFGHFAASGLDADIDLDGSGPDLFLKVYASQFDIEGVVDPDNDEIYLWQTPEIENFTGSSHNFGVLMPQNQAEHPAIHIFNSLIRTRRYIFEKPGYTSPPVRVLWPVAEWSHYEAGPQEIHVLDDHAWEEDTIAHEYGHHFIYSIHTPPPTDYDNGICDAGTPEGDCFPNGGTWQSTFGHCGWCRESFTDAWNEGWPNWLADVVLRDFPTRYQVDIGGPPYQALFVRNYESTNLCCVDNMAHNPLRTEGFVAALLHDIDDATHDDHDGDGIRDLLCLGPNPIFYTLAGDLPTTVSDFITAFRVRYPQQTGKLWATSFNVGGAAYVSGFPADSQPPGVVTVCNSPSHPLGVGGALPCMRFEWEPAPDDGRGATSYSFALSTTVGGVEPDEVAEPVSETSDCKLSGITGYFTPASLYFSIKACDAAGNWSEDWSVFGPFTIVDCNGSGFLDLCDLACQSDGIPGVCSIGGVCFFADGVGCGQSLDCNGNYVPDECDIAQGNSPDCNRDGIPDECQAAIIKNFIGVESEEWGATANWREGATPADGDHVCIPAGTPRTEVFFEEDFRRVSTLNCDIDFRLNDTSAELQIDQPSYVTGDLTLTVGSTLRSMTSLDVAGELDWRGRDIVGPGTVNVYGGLDLTSPVAVPRLRGSAHLSILDGEVNIHGNEFMELADSSSFSIGNGVTYSYDGNSNIFLGTPTTIVNVAGGLIRNSGALNATVNSFVLNSGLIYNRTGDLTLSYGGTHSGEVRGDPGTQLRLNGSHDFLAGSKLNGNDITFSIGGVSNASFIRGDLNVLGAIVVSGATFTVTSEADVASYGQHLLVTAGSARLEAPSTGAGATIGMVTIGSMTTEGSKDARFNTGSPVSFNTLNLIKGDLHGADPITINNSFVWGTGGGQILAGSAIQCNAPSTIQANASARTLSRVFNNAAYATFLGGFSVGSSGSFNNLATGTVELRGNSTGLFGGASTNAGLIVKTQGTGTASSLNGLNNSGLVRAEVGEISFSGGGTNSGTILGLPGTLLRFAGTYEMSTASSLTADDVRLSSVTANMRGTVNIADTLTMDGGTCTFTNEADVTSYGQHLYLRTGTARFEAPTTGSAVAFDTATIGELNAEGGKVARFNTGQPTSINTLNLVEGNIEGADPITINNSFVWGTGGGSIQAGGAITCNGPATIQGASSSRNLFRVFNNAGYATFFGGFSGGSGGNFNNLPTGTVDLRNTGTALGMGPSTTFTNSGTLIKSAGIVSSLFTHFRNTGVVDIQTGTLQLTGTNGLTHIQTAGSTILNGGVLSVTTNTPYQLQGGDLFGVGTISGNILNTAGAIEAGLSTGTLTITGTYVQQPAATMRVEIGGAAPGTFDVIQVGGNATLAGNLHVLTLGGFSPAVGATFVILTANSISGTFGSLSGNPSFAVSYTPTQVILNGIESPCPGDVGGDCDGNGALEPAADIPCFVAALLDPGSAPSCPVARSDVNEDGFTNGLDVHAMVNCIIQGCP